MSERKKIKGSEDRTEEFREILNLSSSNCKKVRSMINYLISSDGKPSAGHKFY